MSQKMFALVKWIGGEDDKTYTSGIPTDWIIGFDTKAFMDDTHDVTESYVVEWRDKKKKPKGGWQCYDCHVVFVSDKLVKVNNHLKILDGATSPKVVNSDVAKDSTSEEKSSPMESTLYPIEDQSDDDEVVVQPKKRRTRKNLTFDDDDDNEEENIDKAGCSGSGDTSKKPKNKKDSPNDGLKNDNITTTNETDLLPTATNGIETPNSSVGNGKDNREDKPDDESVTLADIMAEIKSNKKTIESLQREVREIKEGKSKDPPSHRRPTYDQNPKSNSSTYKNVRDLGDGEFIEGNVEIGPPGSGILVTDLEWTAAISKGTYKAMATSLVTSLFPTDVLLKSNYKGGKSKFKKQDGDHPKYDALDPKILRAILYSVRGMYPKTYTEAGVGQAVNVKLTNIRAKANAEQKSNGKQ